MMRVTLISSLVLVAALSGCLADEAEPASVSSTPTTSAAPVTNATTTSAAPNTTVAANNAPTANLSSDVPNGTAPLNVTFTIEGTDADGDELSWTLDIDGDNESDYNGTELPSEIVHEYLEAGNYTAILNVTDGTNSTQASLDITVEVPIATSLVCDRPDATSAGGELYVISEGGDWVFAEANGIPGLQVENNHPIGEPLWINPAWVGCVGGDQMIN